MSAFRTASLFFRNVHASKSISLRSFSIYYQTSKRCVVAFNPKNVLVRHFNDLGVNEEVQNKYRIIDKVSQDYIVVYRAPMETYVKAAHIMSFYCGAILPCLSLYSFFITGPLEFPVYLGEMPLCRNGLDYVTFHVGFYLLISQLYLIVVRYPLRIYHDNRGNYVAVYRGILPWSKVKEEFKAGEVKKSKAIMPWWKDILYKAKSRYMILFSDYFHRPADFNNMLGKNVIYEEEEED